MSAGHALRLVILTAVIWWLEMLLVQVLAGSLGLRLDGIASLAAIGIIGLGMMIPAAPGYVGTYELSAVTAFGLFGVRPETGAALAVLLHSWVLITTTACGLPALSWSPKNPREDRVSPGPEVPASLPG